jgi:hypothetical protein
LRVLKEVLKLKGLNLKVKLKLKLKSRRVVFQREGSIRQAPKGKGSSIPDRGLL